MSSSNSSNNSFRTAPSTPLPTIATGLPLVSTPQDPSRLTVPGVPGSPVLSAQSLPADDELPDLTFDVVVTVSAAKDEGDGTSDEPAARTDPHKERVTLKVKRDDKEGLRKVIGWINGDCSDEGEEGLEAVAQWLSKGCNDEDVPNWLARLRKMDLVGNSAEKVGDDKFIEWQRALEEGTLEPVEE